MTISYKAKLASATAALPLLFGATVHAQDYPQLDLRGRLHVDAAFHAEDETELPDNILVRRARIGVEGILSELWSFQLEFDFAGEDISTNAASLYRDLAIGTLVIGNQKVPISLGRQSSSNGMPLIERASPVQAFQMSRRLGLRYNNYTEGYGFEAAAFGRGIDEDYEKNGMPRGAAVRLTATPDLVEGHLFHFGVWGSYDDRRQQGITLDERPESRPAGVKLISTGGINDADTAVRSGLEFAYQKNAFTFRTEYLHSEVSRDRSLPSEISRDIGSDLTFDGYYAQASYILTGETRSYRRASFGRVEPVGESAWEVAARYSHLDLSDGIDPIAGLQDNVTLGLNWYPTSSIRFMSNVIFANVSDRPGAPDESPRILLFRTQYSF